MIKHFKTSKWKVPKHEMTDVKDFYDYIENPSSSCTAYALLGTGGSHGDRYFYLVPTPE